MEEPDLRQQKLDNQVNPSSIQSILVCVLDILAAM